MNQKQTKQGPFPTPLPQHPDTVLQLLLEVEPMGFSQRVGSTGLMNLWSFKGTLLENVVLSKLYSNLKSNIRILSYQYHIGLFHNKN